MKRLKKHFPDARCELYHENSFQLLVATILSAQCTDIQVNKVTPELFRQYPTALALGQAPLQQVETLIGSLNFYKNKAKNIIFCAQQLQEKYQGEVPAEMDKLVALAGVGRKTANVVLGNAFNMAEGIVVDTHVKRISRLLGLTRQEDPVKIEADLMQIFPKVDWTLLSHLFIFLGRRVCSARKPLCQECPVRDLCPSRLM